ncbi:hypothetical protein K0O13_07985 [Mammaliicoccus sciuri]|uniref:hypothetical protein n=1 Tax=Mammaliicoccus sciuri TaxID=1296 RepID=UPI001C635FB9|nr:hypothetical protein [Mammaliicoccus sciuri]QYG30039.1 hypothetical protein K0O13_07985 [Mammaliicoccus sciuri]
MWEIYTLYMINEDEKVAVRYYTSRNQSALTKNGKHLINRLGYDRYEIIRMTNEDKKAKLNEYKILGAYEYDDTQDWYVNGMKLSLKTN